jgi:hypothetical protein
MAKKTPKFGGRPFVQLTMTCTTVNISKSTVEKSLLPLSLLYWTIPVVAHWRYKLAKPFFCCLAWFLHQLHSTSNSTSSKTGNYFLYCHLALSLPDVPRTTTMPPDLHWLNALVAGVSLQNFRPILRKVKKHQVHRRVISRWALVYLSIMISVGVFCAQHHLPALHTTAWPISATAGQDTKFTVGGVSWKKTPYSTLGSTRYSHMHSELWFTT